MSDTAQDVLSRVENFVTIRYVNILTDVVLEFVEPAPALIILVVVYTALYLLQNKDARSWEFLCTILMRALILTSSNVFVKLIDTSGTFSTFFHSLQTATISLSILILAYAIPIDTRPLMNRTILLTTYIFVDVITDSIRNIDFGLPSTMIGIIGVLALDIAQPRLNRYKSMVFVVGSFPMIATNIVFSTLADTATDVHITLAVISILLVSIVTEISPS